MWTVLLPLLSLASTPNTWYVDAAGTAPGEGSPANPYTRIDFALAQASTLSGDTIEVAAGVYVDETIDFLGKDVRVVAPAGSDSTEIRGLPPGSGPRHALVRFTGGEGPGAELDGFRLTAGSGDPLPGSPGVFAGGALFIQGSSPTLRNLVVEANHSTDLYGAGVYVGPNFASGEPTRFENCGWFNNQGLSGGAFYLSSARVEFEQCEFRNNAGGSSGAGFGQQSTVAFEDCTFFGNQTGQSGGGGHFLQCELSFDGGSIETGFSTLCGAGWYVAGGTLWMHEVTVQGNSSTCGGGLYLAFNHALIEECQWLANRADEATEGGAIFQLGGSLTVRESLFEGNIAGLGGAICSRSALSGTVPGHFVQLEHCEFRDNLASSIKSFAQPRGGALLTSLPTTIGQSLFQGNLAHFMPAGENQETAHGGAIYALGPMALDGCEFRLNRAQAQHSAMGGAIAALDSAQATRCLFLANSLESPIEEQGTAILGLVDLEHCTLTGNAGGSTGSTVAGSGALHNSILWNNVPSGFEAGASLAWCLNDGPDGGPSVSNLDPRFWSAEDATLMPSSPAIDAGDPASALDADGTAADLGWRPFDAIYCGAGCDGDLGTIYCASNPNSRGLQGRLGALGSATVAGDLLILVASDLPYGAPGYFLGSTGTDFVANFGGSMGNLCLGDPRILRFHASIQNSGPSGRVAQQLSLSDWPEGGVVQAGETWHFQFWHRDFDGITPTSNTTEALAIAY